MSYPPRPDRVGIEKIAAYPCTLSLDLRLLAEKRGDPPDYPRNELNVETRSVNPPWEDPVTMAVNAAQTLLGAGNPEEIGLVLVGTESSPDFGKPISSYVQRFCEIPANCRNLETKHACYSGTGALMLAAHWIASGLHRGKKALVITTDQSRVHLEKRWEYVLGAGAVAMLVSDQPDVLELELEHNGYWSAELADTYRPTSTAEVGHAETSLFGYLEALENTYEAYLAQAGPVEYTSHFKRHIYHVPFGGMTLRAHRALLRREGITRASEVRASFEERVRPSLHYTARMGGTYGSATFLALMSLIDSSDDLGPGDRISLFSYGSGSCAEFYSARIGPRARAVVGAAGLARALEERETLTVEAYEQIERERFAAIDRCDYTPDLGLPGGLYARKYAGCRRLVLESVTGYQRNYGWS